MTECTLQNKNRVNAACVFQGDFGGPIMCKLDNSWFQAAVLTVSTNSPTTTRAAPPMVFTKLNYFDNFLVQILGIFLSPASKSNTTITATTVTTPMPNRGGTPAVSFFLYLLIFIMCLHFFL